jgi:S-adenosyl methyltransferase
VNDVAAENSEENPLGFDVTRAHSARVYNFWLGGKDNFAVDRKAAEDALAANPGMIHAIRANRAFLVRTVHYLAGEEGIRQFLDIGTGLPTANNTHEVAQSVAPESRIVYADNDPMVLAHARALLTSSREGECAYLDADLRDPDAVLVEAARTLDFGKPVAIMLLGILQQIPDDDDPYGAVARLVDAVPPGSFLAVTHPASDVDPRSAAEAARRLNSTTAEQRQLRSKAEVARFFGDLELVEPGLVQVAEWRPDPAAARTPVSAHAVRSGRGGRWAGVARKR